MNEIQKWSHSDLRGEMVPIEDSEWRAEYSYVLYSDYKALRKEISELRNRPHKPNMNGKDIIADWLKEHGYDGLYLPEEDCTCELDCLIQCENDPCYCRAGKFTIGDDGQEKVSVP